MLNNPPTLADDAVRFPAASSVIARPPGLGRFSALAATGTGFEFLAGRRFSLGTGMASLLNTMVRAALHGWWAARPSRSFLAGRRLSLGTGMASLLNTTVRAAFHGWLAARPSRSFLAGRRLFPGTGTHALFNTMARAAFHGWLAARPSAGLLAGRRRLIGTIASPAVHEPVSRTASGCSVREPACLSSPETGETFYHLPVMPGEVVQALSAGPDRVVIDGTLGGGGHSELLLESGASVIGIDRDPEALAHARERLARFGDRFRTWEGNFADLADMPFVREGGRADGLLLDLGVSSRQLDAACRGFSFQREGPLDMRMGPASDLTAAEVVNTWPEAELAGIIRELGEEPKARRIAAAIVARRENRPFSTTVDLAGCIERAIGRHGRIHPATRAFQAIRMTVNDELGSLSRVLTAAPSVLKPGGRLAIITFHSLEDRQVKRYLRHHASEFLDDPGWPSPRPNPDWNFHLPSRKAILPTPGETARNPRSRSAKLRVAQLLDPAS